MKTLSGHVAVSSSSSELLVRATVLDWTLIAHRDYAQVFASLAADWHAAVSPLRLDPLECWSFVYRQARMGAGISDHAGYAIDLNSAHEGAVGPSGGMATMSEDQLRACQSLAQRYAPVLHWGGSTHWGGQYRIPENWDPMHWYVRPGATPAQARDLLATVGYDDADPTMGPSVPPGIDGG